MHSVPDILNPTTLRKLQLQMRGVLRPTGSKRPTHAQTAGSPAGRYWPVSDSAKPGRYFENRPYRQPGYGETGLSAAEVHHGMEIGEITL